MTYTPDFNALDNLTAEGYLRKVTSPCGKYVLYNYTDSCTFEKHWNEHTINARGTIYEIATGNVVARGFPKFWNDSELPPERQAEILKEKNFRVFEKVDGSLIILAHYDGQWRCSTRGSFTSDQALKAQSMLYKYDLGKLAKTSTYLLEVIYPENRIIVNYGSREDLVLLATLDTETGKELSSAPIFTEAKIHNFDTIDQLIDSKSTLGWQDEGFVVRFNNGERVKFKSLEYMRIARIKSNMSPLAFWEKMKNGRVDRDFVQSLPEELRAESDKIVADLEISYQKHHTEVAVTVGYTLMSAIGRIPFTEATKEDKRNLGMYLKAKPVKYPEFAFHVLLKNNEAFDSGIMKMIRPKSNIIV